MAIVSVKIECQDFYIDFYKNSALWPSLQTKYVSDWPGAQLANQELDLSTDIVIAQPFG